MDQDNKIGSSSSAVPVAPNPVGPTPPPLPPVPLVESEPKVIVASGSHKNAFLLGMVAIFLLVGLGAGVYLVQREQDIRSKATSGASLEERMPISIANQKMLLSAVSSVQLVSLMATPSGSAVQLETDKSYPYNSVNFSWQTTPVSDPSISARGYFVYFGTKNPAVSPVDPSAVGEFTASPNFIARDLEPKTTYYLVIQAQFKGDNYTASVYLKTSPTREPADTTLFVYKRL